MVDCRPLTLWIQSTIIRSRTGCQTVLTQGSKFASPDVDGSLIHNRCMILIWNLARLNPELTRAQGLVIASKIGNLAIECQADHQEKACQ